MGIVYGLGIGLVISLAICGVACFGAICARILKDSKEEREAKKNAEK